MDVRKWLAAIAVLIGLGLSGCSNTELAGGNPPETFIEVGDNMYEAKLGTYCWKNRCVDTVGPMDMLEGQQPIQVKPGETITIVMDYKPQPTEFHVIQVTEDEEVEVDFQNHRFTAPTEEGVYYYSYDVWWLDEQEENVSHGDAFYAFAVEVSS